MLEATDRRGAQAPLRFETGAAAVESAAPLPVHGTSRAWSAGGRSKRSWLALVALAACAAPAQAQAQAQAGPSLAPTGWFLQLGVAEETNSATAGLTWRWSRQWALGPGIVSGYWAAAISGWRYGTADGVGYTNLAQLSFTPVVRYTPAAGNLDWFIEGGIGATYTNKVYVTGSRTFSTRFNFGDQIAIGTVFGAAREYEFSLRFEHYSNADLKLPNPGQNFIQLRLARTWP